VESGLDVWRTLAAAQQPEWPDADALRTVAETLSTVPPVVVPYEVIALRSRLAAVARGEAFLLQAATAPRRSTTTPSRTYHSTTKTILQMAVVLTYGASMPVVKVGRVAGQYAKPRSSTVGLTGVAVVPRRYGPFAGANRPKRAFPIPIGWCGHTPIPRAAMNMLRAFTRGGLADLHAVARLNKDFVRTSRAGQRYDVVAQEIDRALGFMRACGVDDDALRSVELYASHEALILEYERALTRVSTARRTTCPVIWSGSVSAPVICVVAPH